MTGELEDWELEECERCGATLPPESPLTRRFCSSNCRQKAYQERRREREKASA